jgi:O-antigen/teichoic acid export membrane protein
MPEMATENPLEPMTLSEAEERRQGKPANASTLVKNSAANGVRLGVSALVAILLPAYLTHHLPVETYGAWVLILQLGAYVGYLDFGVQTAVSKYIAEYEAKGDSDGCGRCASVGLAIMLTASALGILVTLVLAWQVPALFRNIPFALVRDVRISLLFVGISLSLLLATSVFSAIFLGLQRYQIPMMTGVISRILYGAVLCAAVFLHSNLIVMGAAAAAVNVFTALLQFVMWRRLASQIRVSLRAIDTGMVRRMLEYCAVLTVWSVCMLFITGLDITIVGHYAFSEVAYYSIATAPTNLVLLVIGAVLGPLLPATSALSVDRSSEQMGNILLRSSRYSTIILLLTGLPLLVGGYVILHLWVGTKYALHSVEFLRILLIANIIRSLCGPYATMVVATSKQRVATISGLTEAVVNLASSVWLARHMGAMGVALGTLLGAVVGVAVHFGVSMHFTRSTLSISRMAIFVRGLVRPAVMAVPSLVLLPYWWRSSTPGLNAEMWVLWAVTTLLLGWFGSMTEEDRRMLSRMVGSRLKLSPGRG